MGFGDLSHRVTGAVRSCAAQAAAVALTAAIGWATTPHAVAQGLPPPGGFAQGGSVCARLEAQLAAIERGGNDTRAEQIRRYEEAVARQQQELDRLTTQQRRQGCEGGFFLFGGAQSPQCDQINGQIQRMRGNLDRMLAGLRQLQSGGSGQDEQRRAVLAALAQNECGPQYRQAARPRGFFETLFGGPPRSGGGGGVETTSPESWGDPNQNSTFRTVCVRTCDGSFFPISFSTNQSRFRDDERICQRMCPAAEVHLYTHRNPGEDIAQAVSLTGQAYTSLPTAFRFRQEFNPGCTCKSPGQSWSEAVGEDHTLERGDVVVTEERARSLSQPKQPGQPKQAQPRQPKDSRSAAQSQPATADPPPPPAVPPSAPPAAPAAPPRAVGPQFYR